jgi:RNA polymerase sigma-70 factor (ECF subfamily)
MAYPDEKDLLKRVAAGDETAFSRLYQQWWPFLGAHIYRITESKPVTEEIVQDVFLKIWQVRETLTEIQHFKSYLLIVSKNHALNALKKKARESAKWKAYIETESREPGQEADDSRSPYSLIDEAIDQLPPRQKQVYLLHRQERFTYRQIAGQLGISRETVKTHLGLAVTAISRYVRSKLLFSMFFLLFLKK